MLLDSKVKIERYIPLTEDLHRHKTEVEAEDSQPRMVMVREIGGKLLKMILTHM